MGAEFYAHFGVKADAAAVRADRRPAWTTRAAWPRPRDEGEAVVVARLTPRAGSSVGEPTEVWLDATKLHFFDADSGESLSSS